jgi:hypothetical protein
VKPHFPARARPRGDGRTETKLEASYRAHLEVLKAAGRIHDYRARGPLNLRLADKTFFRPDFLVIATDGTLELHETKGHWEDDARVKIKVASEMYPWFLFRAIQKVKGEWRYEEF